MLIFNLNGSVIENKFISNSSLHIYCRCFLNVSYKINSELQSKSDFLSRNGWSHQKETRVKWNYDLFWGVWLKVGMFYFITWINFILKRNLYMILSETNRSINIVIKSAIYHIRCTKIVLKIRKFWARQVGDFIL